MWKLFPHVFFKQIIVLLPGEERRFPTFFDDAHRAYFCLCVGKFVEALIKSNLSCSVTSH